MSMCDVRRYMFKTTITGQPIAKKAPRFARMGKFVKTYQPADVKAEESIYLMKLKESLPDRVFYGNVAVNVRFYMQRPKTHVGTGKNKNRLKENAPVFCDKKPDIDKAIAILRQAMEIEKGS